MPEGAPDHRRALHDREGRQGTGTPMLTPRLLLRPQRDRILGPRAWPSARPPPWATVGQTVVCQPLRLCKPAQYLARSVLSAWQTNTTPCDPHSPTSRNSRVGSQTQTDSPIRDLLPTHSSPSPLSHQSICGGPLVCCTPESGGRQA